MKKIIPLTLLAVIISVITLYSQVLPENPTLTDITNFKEDITTRLKKIPNSESEILAERNWITAARVSLQSLRNDLMFRSKEKPNIENFRTDLLGLADRIANLNCNSLEDCKATLEDVKKAYILLVRDQSIVPYEEPKEWISIEEKFNILSRCFPFNVRLTPVPFTNNECLKLKTAFSNEQIRKDINLFIDSRKGELEKESKENAEKLDMVNQAEKEVATYYQKLSEAILTVSTKSSLQTNLYLMILIIGLLSIATIGIIRLFPEKVMREWVESGQVIQFVTVMILLSVIMALGLAGLLSENTLGTLLGGIGGYVLSQGVGRAAARAALSARKNNDPT